MLTLSCNIEDTALQVRNRKVLSVSVVDPLDHRVGWEFVPHTASPGKDPNSKFKVRFLLCA